MQQGRWRGADGCIVGRCRAEKVGADISLLGNVIMMPLDPVVMAEEAPYGQRPLTPPLSPDSGPLPSPPHTRRIISRMPDSTTKAELLTAIDCPREAAEVAAKLRDGDLLARIQGLVPATSPAGLAISQIKERFQAGFR